MTFQNALRLGCLVQFTFSCAVLEGGDVYGTLCCFGFGVNPRVTQQDFRKLRYTAELAASKISRSRPERG